MSSQIITVDDLIDEVRSMLDETNVVSVSDSADILPALNRAQNYAANILARHYESPMLKWVTVTPVSGQMEYDIPEDAFEQRIEKIELKINNQYQQIKRLSYRDISAYESSTGNPYPDYYAVIGNRYRLVPGNNTSYSLRLWYLVEPMRLVKSQGRINIVNTAGNYVIVDTVGSDLTTESDQLASYINIIDAQTGKRKASYQVQNISGNRITFKTVPTRSTVLNIDIDNSLTDLIINEDTDNQGADVSINPDDFVCLIKGACVPFFKKPFSNFLIEYAVAEIRRKLGDSDVAEQEVLKRLEKQVERSWVGQEQSLRVDNASRTWNMPTRRIYGPRG